ncbi:30073_t:CDS:1, partial [Racocetra persica]
MTPIMMLLNYDIPKLPTNNKSIATKFSSDVLRIKNEQAVSKEQSERIDKQKKK